MFKFCLILLFPLIFIGCSSTNSSVQTLVYIESVNDDIFRDYFFISARLNNNQIDIISLKKDSNECHRKLTPWTYYKLTFDSVNVLPNVSSYLVGSGGGTIIQDERGEIWRNDTITRKMYISSDLAGNCIKNSNIFHYP